MVKITDNKKLTTDNKKQETNNFKTEKELVKESVKSSKIPIVPKKAVKEPETMEELMAVSEYKFKGVKRGDFVEGVIRHVSGKEILVDIGAKTEGIVQAVEIPYIRDFISRLKVGDTINCYIVSPENDEGQVVLSLRKASMENKWEDVYKAQKENSILLY